MQSFWRDWQRKLPWSSVFYYTLVFLALVCLKYQYRPIRSTLGLQAEMWAEAVVLYFQCAHFTGDFSCYWQVDAGYLAFLPRLMATLIELLQIPLRWIAHAQQFFALLLLIACCGSVTLKRFEAIYGGWLSRLLLAVLLTFHSDYELHSFINVSYYLIIPAASLLVLAVVDRGFSWPNAFFAGLLVGLAILSKGVLVCLVPMVGLASIFLAVQKKWQASLALALPSLIAASLQIFTLMNSRKVFQATVVNAEAPLPRLLWTTISTFVHGFYSLVINFESHLNRNSWFIALAIVTLLAAVAALWWYLKKFWSARQERSVTFGTAVLIFFGGALAAHVISVFGSLFFQAFRYPEFNLFPRYGRNWFVQAALLLCGLWFLSQTLAWPARFRLRLQKSMVALLLFLIIGSFGYPFLFFQEQRQHDTMVNNFSNWTAFGPLVEDGFGCVPLNPYPWFYGRHCKILSPVYPWGQFEETLTETQDSFILRLPSQAASFTPRMVGFYVATLPGAVDRSFMLSGETTDGTRFELEALPRNGSSLVFFKIDEQQRPWLRADTKLALQARSREAFRVSVPDAADRNSAAVWLGR